MRAEAAGLAGALLPLASCFLPPPVPRFAGDVDEVRHLQRQTERLAGRGRGAPIAVRFESDEEIGAFVATSVREKVRPEDVAAMERMLVAFGLAAPGLDLDGAGFDALLRIVAGVYDEATKTVRVRGDLPGAASEHLTLVHEVAHAVDDASHDLSRFTRAGFDERASAGAALVEGSANAAMLDHLTAIREGTFADAVGAPFGSIAVSVFPGESEDDARDPPLPEGSPERARLEAVPPALRVAFAFPYGHGLAFVHDLRRRYGSAMVARAFADPPVSTEQILHPDRYHARRDDPVEIRLGSFGTPGLREVARGTLGEYGVRLVLGEWVSRTSAEFAARDWEGDAYRVLEAGDGRLALLWHTEWESGFDAEVFADELADAWEERFSSDARGDSRGIVVPRPDGLVARIEREGRRVLVADGFSAGDARVLLATMARDDEVVPRPAPPSPSVFPGLAGVVRPFTDFERFDHSSRATLLSGVVGDFERTEWGWNLSALAGAVLRIRANEDRTSVSTFFGLVSFERNHLAGMTSAYAGPLLAVGASGEGHSLSLLGLVGHAAGPGGFVLRTGLVNLRVRRTLQVSADGKADTLEPSSRRVSLLFGLVSFDA